MAWELRAVVLGSLLLLGAAPAPLQVSIDLNAAEASSVMTGTVGERNEKIKTMLEKGTAKVEQTSFQQLGIGTVFQLLSMQARVDIRPDWAALEKVGITRE